MESYLLVPKAWLETLMENQKRILSLLEGNGVCEKGNTLNGYVTETEAKKYLDRKTTWFWQMRSSGRLPFAKVGSKIFYHQDDIAKLLKESPSPDMQQIDKPEINPLLKKVS
jgi:hypothetical protein